MSRVTKHHGAIYSVLKARTRYRCGGHLTRNTHYIMPGDQYVASALPPDDPDVGNESWMHHRLCMDCCPAEYAEGATR